MNKDSKVQNPRSKVRSPKSIVKGRPAVGLAKAGLTLIEVMLALTILGIGLTVLVAAASRCLAVVRQSKNYERARLLLARVELEHPLQLEEKIEAGDENGTFDGREFDKCTWTRKIEVEGKEEDKFFKVTTRVSWSEVRGVSSEEVVTYLYAPEEKQGGSFVRKPQ